MEYWKPVIEIALLFIIIYITLGFMRGSRGEGILKGVAFVFLGVYGVLFYVAKYFYLEQLTFLLANFLTVSVFALIIIFQPELRRALIRVGQTNPLMKGIIRDKTVIDELVKAVLQMSKMRVGALIALEREVGLRSYIEGGVALECLVSSEILQTIFYPGTSLHDGAIVIREDRIAAASCLFPLTESTDVAKDLGTRHRAGIGVTEESDAIVLIVSEETGGVSVAFNRKLHKNLDKEGLIKLINELYF